MPKLHDVISLMQSVGGWSQLCRVHFVYQQNYGGECVCVWGGGGGGGIPVQNSKEGVEGLYISRGWGVTPVQGGGDSNQ